MFTDDYRASRGPDAAIVMPSKPVPWTDADMAAIFARRAINEGIEGKSWEWIRETARLAFSYARRALDAQEQAERERDQAHAEEVRRGYRVIEAVFGGER